MPDPGGLKGQMAPGDAHPYLAPFDFLRKCDKRGSHT